MKVGDLVRWTATHGDVFVTGIIVETDVRPDSPTDFPPCHRVILGGDLEAYLYTDSLEVLSASR